MVDALGLAVKHIGNIHKYAREEDIPEHTIFVITTDGMENASRIYSSDKVKKMVSKKTEKPNSVTIDRSSFFYHIIKMNIIIGYISLKMI